MPWLHRGAASRYVCFGFRLAQARRVYFAANVVVCEVITSHQGMLRPGNRWRVPAWNSTSMPDALKEKW
jgi:hypothetical protein